MGEGDGTWVPLDEVPPYLDSNDLIHARCAECGEHVRRTSKPRLVIAEEIHEFEAKQFPPDPTEDDKHRLLVKADWGEPEK